MSRSQKQINRLREIANDFNSGLSRKEIAKKHRLSYPRACQLLRISRGTDRNIIKVYKVGEKVVHSRSDLVKNKMRRCPGCDEYYHFDEYPTKTIAGINYFRGWCRFCDNDKRLEKRRAVGIGERKCRPSKYSSDGLLFFECSKCKTYKHELDFWKHSNMKFGRQPICIECSKIKYREWKHEKATTRFVSKPVCARLPAKSAA